MASSGIYSLEVRPRGQSFTLPSKLASVDQASFVYPVGSIIEVNSAAGIEDMEYVVGQIFQMRPWDVGNSASRSLAGIPAAYRRTSSWLSDAVLLVTFCAYSDHDSSAVII
jgi:hypothetical protein